MRPHLAWGVIPFALLTGCADIPDPVHGVLVDPADCTRARELLETGGNVAGAPSLPGVTRQASAVLEPGAQRVPAGQSELGTPDSRMPKLVLVAELGGVESGAPGLDTTRDEIWQALTAQNWTVADAGSGGAEGRLTSFSLRFRRADVSGSLSTVGCTDRPQLLYLEQLPAPGRPG